MAKLLFLLIMFITETAYSQYYVTTKRSNITVLAPTIGYDTEQMLNIGGSLAYFSVNSLNILGVSGDASAGVEKMSIGASLHAGGVFGECFITPLALKYARYYEYESINYREFISVGGYLGNVFAFLGINTKQNSSGILGVNYYFN